MHKMRKYSLALKDLDEALQLIPNYTAALQRRALVHLTQGRLEKAISDYSQLIRLEPGNPDFDAFRAREM